MMTTTLRIALILVSLGTLFLMMRRIRQSRLQIESAVFWILLALVLVIFSLFPQAADFAAHCLGIYSTANFLFLFAIFVLIVKVFYMTIHISQLETKLKDLVQRMALDEKRNEEEKRLLEEKLRAAETGGSSEEAEPATAREGREKTENAVLGHGGEAESAVPMKTGEESEPAVSAAGERTEV